jgi:septal ring factor EnvC (AmiA/AmiB activator)
MQPIKPEDLAKLSSAELGALLPQLISKINAQVKHITEQASQIDEHSRHIGAQSEKLANAERGIKWRDVKIADITFQLARLRAWRFGAKYERMNAEQRELFAEALAADIAGLETQLAALQSQAGEMGLQVLPTARPGARSAASLRECPAHPGAAGACRG